MTTEMEWLLRAQAAQRSIDDLLGPKGGDPRERELAEAWDEVERLRGVVERLELEKFALAEELVRLRGQKKGMNPAAAVVDPPAVAGRTRGGDH